MSENKNTLQQHNTRLSENNVDLSSILDKINKLPTVEKVVLQEKTVTPTSEIQEVVADEEYTALSKVTVEKITGDTIEVIPSAEQQNFSGVYTDVKVVGDENLVAENIKKDVKIFGVVGTLEGGWDTSQIRDCRYMFYQNTEIVNAPYFDTSNVTHMSYMFAGCENLKTVPNYNMSKLVYTSYMFRDCTNLEMVGNFDTSNVVNMSYMFSNCRSENLVIPLLNCGKVTSINGILSMSYTIESVLGFKDLGKGYTRTNANYNNYTLDLSDCSYLTYDSLMNIINNLYDLNLTYDVANGGTLYTQQLVLGSDNLAKLTAEEIAIATNKGWSVS